MATDAAAGAMAESVVEGPEKIYVRKTFSLEFLAQQEEEPIERRVLEEGAKRIRRSCERLIAMGFYDQDGNRIQKELPADMQPGADRDFGG